MDTRFIGSIALLALVSMGCADKGGDSTGPSAGTPSGSSTGTGTGAGTGTGTGTATGTGTPTGDPPIADYANCEAHGELVETSGGDAYRRGLWYFYDADGLVERIEQDLDANQSREDNWTYAYDAQGRRTDEWHDLGGDGTFDSHTQITWSANDNHATLSFDNDNDGTFDAVYTNTEDAMGRVILQEGDEDNDGVLDSTYDWVYDGNGDLTREQYDLGMDGVYEYSVDYTRPGTVGGDYVYEWDSDADGSYDGRGEQAHDGGLVTFLWEDWGPDAVVDVEIDFSYYGNGVDQGYVGTFFDPSLVLITGGFYDYIQQKTYDLGDGKLQRVQELADLDQDGAPGGQNDVLYTETWTYTGCTAR